MEAWIEFGRGPLFRLAFSLMVLGLLRIFVLTSSEWWRAYRRNPDKIVHWKEVGKPDRRVAVPHRPVVESAAVYSTFSFLFHVGLLLVPLFLAAHVLLWKRSSGSRGRRSRNACELAHAAGDCRRPRPVPRPRGSTAARAAEPPAGLRLAAAAGRAVSPPATSARTLAIGPKAYQAADADSRLLGRPDHAADSVHQDRALRAGAAVAAGDRRGLEIPCRGGRPGGRHAGLRGSSRLGRKTPG